jgi:hypothetical protein
VVKLTATAAPGSTFTGFGGACAGTRPCQLVIGSSETVSAKFELRPRCSLKVKSTRVLLARPTGAAGRGRSRVSPGTFTLTVRCTQAARVQLTGRVDAVDTRTHRSVSSVLRGVTRNVRAGVSTSVTVSLPKRAFAALRAGAHESVALSLVATNALGRARTTGSIASLRPVR